MTFIPEVIKDIIYTYINELKTEEILLELQSKVKTCRGCDEEKVVIKNINDGRCKCGEFLCSDCYYSKIFSLSGLHDQAVCIYCLDYDVSEWQRSADEYDNVMYDSEVEDDDWQDMHGIAGYSQMY